MTDRITKNHIIFKYQLTDEINNTERIIEKLNELRKDIPNMTLFNLEATKKLFFKKSYNSYFLFILIMNR